MTISGAYGRDYKSKAQIIADLEAGKDFTIRDLFSGGGSYINLSDLQKAGVRSVMVRYKRDAKVASIKVPR